MPDTQTVRHLPLGAKPSLIVAQVGVHGDPSVARYVQESGLWSLHLYMYSAELRIGAERHALKPGTLGIAPPNCTLEYHMSGRSEHLYCLFNAAVETEPVAVPAIQYLEDRYDAFLTEFQEMVVASATNPLRAEVKLWDILLHAAEGALKGQSAAKLHPAVDAAVKLIERKMGEPIAVADLVKAADISHSHLIRLFRAQLGAPPVQYIANRRTAIASHLLRHTTIPIKAIAEQVGIPDLQLFNKMIRRATGHSPSRFRQQGDFPPP